MDEVRAYQYKNLEGAGIDPAQYGRIDDTGVFSGILDAKAWGKKAYMLLFITLDTGGKIGLVAWQNSVDHGKPVVYCNADDIPIGSKVKIRLSRSTTGKIHLDRITAIQD